MHLPRRQESHRSPRLHSQRLFFWLPLLSLIGSTLVSTLPARARQAALSPKAVLPSKAIAPQKNTTTETPEKTPPKADEESEESASFEEIVADTERTDGLFPLYQNNETGDLYLEIAPEDLDRPYLLIMTLSQGLGDLYLIEGLPLGDLPVEFRRQNDKILLVVPNTFFRTDPGDPQAQAVDRAFSESILAALTIEATHPERNTLLVNFGNLLIDGDLSGLAGEMGSLAYSFQRDRSYLSQVQNFPENIEIETSLGFSSGSGFLFLESVPDSRAFSLGVRYSLSPLPQNTGYRPRPADRRVGYFITAYRNLSDIERPEPFTRYIQRWHLKKQDPTAELSPPVEPIVFWIENTVPEQYRQTIREGVLMWNRAFEAAGYLNAIEVRQMPDDADWNPADVRYNTIRWSTSFRSSFAGIGPSRVNPWTGEILDADILINANIVRWLQRESDTLLSENSSRLFVDLPGCVEDSCASSQPEDANSLGASLVDRLRARSPLSGHRLGCHCRDCTQAVQEGQLALSLLSETGVSKAEREEYVRQYLRFLVAHEVGHTLGLRHNFHGSTLRSPEELHNVELTRTEGLSGSVMDYLPPNIAPPGTEQGEYFPTVVGPYDEWAIAYGYEDFNTPYPQGEHRQLETILSQSSRADLAYGTDEDLWAEIDPAVNWFDLSNDMLVHAGQQMQMAQQMWSRLDLRTLAEGEPPEEMRVRFDLILGYYFRQARILLKHIGGQSFTRAPNGGELPFEPLPASQQRQSLAMLEEYFFAANAFEFPPELLNQLTPSRWFHWGSTPAISRLDYPIHERILGLQQQVLRSLLSGERLVRLRDLELKTPPDEEAFVLPELFESLYRSIWGEVLQGRRVPTNISSLRRALQREHLNASIDMALGRVEVPEDARTLARYYLNQLDTAIEEVLRRYDDDLDTYTQAHLEDTQVRVRQALDAQMFSN